MCMYVYVCMCVRAHVCVHISVRLFKRGESHTVEYTPVVRIIRICKKGTRENGDRCIGLILYSVCL